MPDKETKKAAPGRSPLRILFVCMGNACRSQMAEGMARLLAPGWEVHSAGLLPAGFVSPHAVAVMEELGVDISSQWSKGLDEVDMDGMQVIIAMGGFPVSDFVASPEGKIAENWKVADPIGHGPEFFRIIRDQIRSEIEALALRLAEKSL